MRLATEGLALEGPLEGLGHGAVEVVDESEDLGAQVVLRGEVAPTEDPLDEDTEPDFTEPNLAHVLSIVRKPPRVAGTCLP